MRKRNIAAVVCGFSIGLIPARETRADESARSLGAPALVRAVAASLKSKPGLSFHSEVYHWAWRTTPDRQREYSPYSAASADVRMGERGRFFLKARQDGAVYEMQSDGAQILERNNLGKTIRYAAPDPHEAIEPRLDKCGVTCCDVCWFYCSFVGGSDSYFMDWLTENSSGFVDYQGPDGPRSDDRFRWVALPLPDPVDADGSERIVSHLLRIDLERMLILEWRTYTLRYSAGEHRELIEYYEAVRTLSDVRVGPIGESFALPDAEPATSQP